MFTNLAQVRHARYPDIVSAERSECRFDPAIGSSQLAGCLRSPLSWSFYAGRARGCGRRRRGLTDQATQPRSSRVLPLFSMPQPRQVYSFVLILRLTYNQPVAVMVCQPQETLNLRD